MRRVLEFLEWHAQWWESWPNALVDLPPERAEGMMAYTIKQAHIRQSIRTSFNHLWRCLDEFIKLGIGTDNDILDLQDPAMYKLLDLPPID